MTNKKMGKSVGGVSRDAGCFDRLRTGSSTAWIAKSANHFAQDDMVLVVAKKSLRLLRG
jgi:hypothetical protein